MLCTEEDQNVCSCGSKPATGSWKEKVLKESPFPGSNVIIDGGRSVPANLGDLRIIPVDIPVQPRQTPGQRWHVHLGLDGHGRKNSILYPCNNGSCISETV